MALETYKKKIESYVKDKMSSAKSTESSKGLLAPKEPMTKQPKGTGVDQDPVTTVGELVYAIRQKRMELLSKRSKK